MYAFFFINGHRVLFFNVNYDINITVKHLYRTKGCNGNYVAFDSEYLHLVDLHFCEYLFREGNHLQFILCYLKIKQCRIVYIFYYRCNKNKINNVDKN